MTARPRFFILICVLALPIVARAQGLTLIFHHLHKDALCAGFGTNAKTFGLQPFEHTALRVIPSREEVSHFRVRPDFGRFLV
jgi:hypothetical protein